jgi:hypothetical protein
LRIWAQTSRSSDCSCSISRRRSSSIAKRGSSEWEVFDIVLRREGFSATELQHSEEATRLAIVAI